MRENAGGGLVQRLRTLASGLVRTPLHPQWLMPANQVDPRIAACRGTVLDVGTGSRWVRGHLHAPATYVTLDYPPTGRDLYGSRPDIFGDARRLPFRDGCMDAVVCYEVLEHVSDPDAALAEIGRVLREGGVAELTMPFLYPVHDAPYDFQRWTAHGWARSAAAAGLRVEECTPAGHPLHVAAVLGCLALTAPLAGSGTVGVLLRLPFAMLLVPVVNLSAWAMSKVWPEWPAMAVRYRLLMVKAP